MSDLIVGYPTNFTVVSDNGAGSVRVTYASWELDWEFFLAIAVDGTNSLANVTTGVSAAVTAKGGSENLGYWFDINQAFPSANWNTGDRIAPQRQLVTNWFTTIGAAKAVAVMNDCFLMWYERTPYNIRCWIGGIGTLTNLSISVWGMLSRRQISIVAVNAPVLQVGGNLLAQGARDYVRNITAGSYGPVPDISWYPNAGQGGPGIEVSRCTLYSGFAGAGGGGIVLGRTTLAPLIFNNILIDNGVGISATNLPSLNAYNNTVINTYGQSFSLSGTYPVFNCVASECGACFSVSAASRNCAGTDGTLPVDPTNLRNRDARSEFRFFADVAGAGNTLFHHDYHILGDSILAGAGTPAGAPLYDADGVLRPNPPSIGAFEPVGCAYVPAAELLRAGTKSGVKA